MGTRQPFMGVKRSKNPMLWGCFSLVFIVVMFISVSVIIGVFPCVLWLVRAHGSWGKLLLRIWKKRE
jgi:hypothetical protein